MIQEPGDSLSKNPHTDRESADMSRQGRKQTGGRFGIGISNTKNRATGSGLCEPVLTGLDAAARH